MRIFKIFLAAILIGSAATEMQAVPDNVKWVRPVKEDKEFKVSDTVVYHFVKGEWFEVASKDCQDIIYKGDTLATNAAEILDGEVCDSLSKRAAMGLVDPERVKIENDSILIFDFTCFDLGDKVRLINAADGLVVDTLSLNRADTIAFGDKLSRNATVRLSPENNVAEVLNLAEIKPIEQPTLAPVEASDVGKGVDMLILILISVIGILVIGIAVLVFMMIRGRKAKIVKPVADEVNEDNENGECEDSPRSEKEEHTEEEAPALVDVVALKAEMSMLIAKNSTLNKQLLKAKEDLAAEQTGRKQAIEAEAARIRQKADKEIATAESRAEKAEEKARTIKQEVTERFKTQIETLESEKAKLNDHLSETKSKLRETTDSLTAETAAHAQAVRKIETLDQAIARFGDKLSDAAFARSYCQNIEALLSLSAKVQDSANAALAADVEDPYFIFKSIARFSAQLGEINLPAFYTDVDMVLRTGFVPKGTPLAAYDPSLPKAELESLTKNYFFVSYLKQYINALVVFNESMAGLAHLLPDMPADIVRPFEQYRGEIQSAVAALEINVLSVKIFDFVHNNTDLLATQVDGGYDTPGVILDIENCLVSLVGAPRDGGERIRVKVQQ